MQRRPFKQVDVFTREPFLGNPVAVVLQADGLSAAQMQHIARWTNLSETAFVLAPSDAQAHYRVRMFTPGAELPFAGSPDRSAPRMRCSNAGSRSRPTTACWCRSAAPA